MAGMLKKIVGRCWQSVAKESISAFEGRGLKRKYGNRAKAKGHAKTFGLLSCYQIQQGNGTERSLTDRPEPPGPREMGIAVTGRVGGQRSSPSVICIHSAALPSPQFTCPISEAQSEHSVSCPHNVVTSSSHHQNRTKMTKMCVSLSDAAAGICDKMLRDVHSLLAHHSKYRKFDATYSSKMFHAVDNGHVSWFSFANQFLTQQIGKISIKTCGIHVRHYAARARSRRPVQRQKNYYEVLGITPNATQAQVKAAYFNLSKVYHPDKNAGCKDAHSRFAAINEAYSVLGNLTLRKRYDRGTLSQKDIHGDVSKEEKAHEHHQHSGEPVYTGTGIPFNEEAKRQAKNLDDFFSKHYKDALDKERRERVERKQRMEEYMEMQQKAKISPAILALFMLVAVSFAVKSVASTAAVDKKLRGGKEKL